jgi:hypothetical protein
MTPEDYNKLASEISELIQGDREPSLESDFAFIKGYEDRLMEVTLLKSYAELMFEKPRCNIKCLHAFLIGYSTADSLDDNINFDISNKKNTYH